jgi:uncharacterized protein (DUF433 family)
MTLVITAVPPPLAAHLDGTVRVAKTRVTLDTVVAAFHDGATAEEIAQQYPSLSLADVYVVIGYYLCQQAEVDAYLRQRRQQAARVRDENERHFDPAGVPDRLLAWRTRQG